MEPAGGQRTAGADERAALARLHGWIAPRAGELVGAFYAEVRAHAATREVLERLSAAEFATLQARQAMLLADLVAPDSAPRTLAEAARHSGRVHALLGLGFAAVVEAHGFYQRILSEYLRAAAGGADGAGGVAHAAMQSVLQGRLLRDLQGQAEAYAEIEEEFARATVRVWQTLAEAQNFTDLAGGVLGILGGLSGIVAGSLGRPDAGGVFRYEAVAGEALRDYFAGLEAGRSRPTTVHENDPTGLGASGRAWRSRRIQHTLSYATDPAIAPWREIASACGIRSAISIPILDAQGEPRALIDLYAAWPGYFTAPARGGFFAQLMSLLGLALAKLQAGPVVPFAARANYRSLLEAGALEMVFQPVVDLATGRVLKIEALARLRQPSGQLLAPAAFLPAFGTEDLLRLFEAGLAQLLFRLNAWRAAGLDTRGSLNLPAQGLTDPRYLAVIEGSLARAGTPPMRLTLELLEHAELGEASRHDGALERLRRLGVHLAQDDLGAGYSSLQRLDRVRFDEVKIDHGLLRGVAEAPQRTLDLIRHLTRLVHDLGIAVVVEGLEDPGLIESAAVLGADAGQGFGIARPLAADAVVAWAANFRLRLDRARPATALGAYATHILWVMQCNALAPWPELLARFVVQPGGLGHYIASQGEAAQTLARLRAAMIGAAGNGIATPAFRSAEKRIRGLLGTRHRMEAARWAHPHRPPDEAG